MNIDVMSGSGTVDDLLQINNTIINKLVEISEFDTQKEFSEPFILSFLAHYVLPGNFVPTGYLLKTEMNKLQFNCFGQLQENIPTLVSKMLIAGFFILRIFIEKICFRPSEVLFGVDVTAQGLRNMQNIGVSFYYMFLELFGGLADFPGNVENIKIFDEPTYARRCLTYSINFTILIF